MRKLARPLSLGDVSRGARSLLSGGRSRHVAMALTGMTCLVLGSVAIAAVHGDGNSWTTTVRLLADAMIAVPALGLLYVLHRPVYNLPLAIYWAWSFVFMGLAPAYQLATETFPWMGTFSATTIVTCQVIVLVGHSATILGVWLAARWKRAGTAQRQPEQPAETPLPASHRGTSRALEVVAYAYTACGILFVGLMGADLYQGRAIFIERLLRVAELPFGGSLFFLASAGAIAVPAAVVAARRSGIPVGLPAILAAMITAAVVTNPLLGSRFLTGSFVVALVAGWVGPRILSRYLPVLSIVLLIVVFPTLDVLRGNGTGSEGIGLLSAGESLVNFDFDAFEMLAREVSLTDADRAQLPDRVDIALAPVLRWVPILARPYIGLSGGAVVAEATGMDFTDVSMPLWGEGHLVGGLVGVVLVMLALGLWLGIFSRAPRRKGRRNNIPATVAAPGTAALMFIILRGSLYEVFGYLALVVAIFLLVHLSMAKDEKALTNA